MKRFFALFLCLILCLSLGGVLLVPAAAAAEEPATLKVVTTIFPIYDWVRELLGDDMVHAEVHMLLDTGVDLHSYQPTVDDIITIADCDLFIYTGGESDAWVSDALASAQNPDRVVLSLMDILGSSVKTEELVEGMEADHDHEHEHEEEHDHDHEEEHEEEPEYDEHVWLSLKNARVLCAAIADALAELDTDCAEHYAENAAVFDEKLASLDAEYAAAVESAAFHTLLFGDRFPFRYLTDDYDLDYYAAFAGCSAETEASFATVTFLAAKLDELGLPAVLTIEGSDGRIAQTIVENTERPELPILTLDSMQSVTAEDLAAGVTYLGVMEKNLDALTQALNG